MTILANLLPIPKLQFFDNNGVVLAGGKIYTYAADGATPKATYQDAAQSILNTNPIELDSAGRCLEGSIYGLGNYVWGIFDSNGVQIYTQATADTTESLQATAFGLSLLQAADQAAAQALLGITASDSPIAIAYPFAGPDLPTGWAWCNGQDVSRAGNPLLFTALSTTWGAGNGTTTFNLPDLRGVAFFGVDSMGGSGPAGRVTAASLGVSTVLGLISGDQLAQEDTITGGLTDPGHSHTETIGAASGSGGSPYTLIISGYGTSSAVQAANWPTSNTGTGITIDVSGSLTGAKQNMPPCAFGNWIIKLG